MTGLRFALLGIPVTIRPSIVVVLALFGLAFDDPVLIALWVGIGVASIVVHELGHAVVARAAGASPTIELAGLGGVTTYPATGRAAERSWRLAVSLAGPAVGLVVGGLAWVVTRGVALSGYGGAAVSILLFTSIGWSVFNLLPVLPLDGGQALRQLLPGDATTRTVRAAWVGVATSGAVLVVAVLFEQLFIMLFAGMLAIQNWRTANAPAQARAADQRVQAMLADRDWRSIRDVLADGGGDRALAEAAQRGAAETGSHQLAAEIGEIAIARGADDDGFVRRTADAWEELGAVDRAAAVRAGRRPAGPDAATSG